MKLIIGDGIIGQIREFLDHHSESSLKYHRISWSGHPKCGQRIEKWNGQEMVLVIVGQGKPTCGSCNRMAEELIA